MKTTTHPNKDYIHSGVMAIVGLLLIGVMLNVTGQDLGEQYFSTPSITRGESTFIADARSKHAELDAYCKHKVNIGMLAFDARKGGETLDVVLESLRNFWDMPKDKRVPVHQYLEYERMAQTVYRREEYITADEIAKEFFEDCLYMRF